VVVALAGGHFWMQALKLLWQLCRIAMTVGFVRQLSRQVSRHSKSFTCALSTHSKHCVSDDWHGA